MAQINSLSTFIQSNLGRKRTNNEDSIAFYEPGDPVLLETRGRLFIVADGVGGEDHGEIASQYAVLSVLYNYFRESQRNISETLETEIRRVCRDIYSYTHREDQYSRMATTFVAAAIWKNELIVANVGDSRAYIIRHGHINQLTHDHNYVAEMVRNGVLSPEEAKTARGKNKLTRSVGGETDVTVDIFTGLTLQEGDRIILCSDGLTRYAEDEKILELAQIGTPEQAVNAMIRYANECGGEDNISAALIEVGLLTETNQLRRKGEIQKPQSLEQMLHKPYAAPIKNIFAQIRKPKALSTPLTIILAIAAFSFIAVDIFLGIRFFANRASETELATATGEQISTLPVAIVTQEPANLSFTPSPESLPSTITPTPRPSICIAQLGQNQTLIQVLDSFGLTYQAEKEYRYMRCSGVGPETCDDPEYIEDAAMIPAEVWIIIPLEQTEECISKGGSIYQPPVNLPEETPVSSTTP